jgi:hypothetical protein
MTSLYTQWNELCSQAVKLVLLGISFTRTFLGQCHHMSLMDFVVSPTSDVGTHVRGSYVVPMRWMVIYEYDVPGGALSLSSTKLPRPWSPWESSPSRKNPHDRTGNRTRDLISSQKLWPLDHKTGPFTRNIHFDITSSCQTKRFNTAIVFYTYSTWVRGLELS